MKPFSIAESTIESAKKAFIAGDLAAAERLCRAVIAAAPALAVPWILLGDIALERRKPDSALVWADKAIALEPRNPFGYLLRCRTLMVYSRLRDAFETARAGVRIRECPPAALDEFGTIFSQLGRYDQVIDCFKRAIAADPTRERYVYNLAVAERMSGDLEAAEIHFDQVVARNRHFYDAYLMRADLRKQTKDRNHIAEMEALLTAGPRDANGEIAVRFALAKECEDIGDYPRGFRHLERGADLKRRALRYDIGVNVDIVDRLIQGQTRAFLDAAAGRFDPQALTRDDPIFIVGLPRSGTTLLERIVNSHPAVAAGGELTTLPHELTRAALHAGMTQPGEWVERMAEIDFAALGAAYSRIARETGIPDGKRLTDKYPSNYLYCGVIRAAFPNARIIVLERRPMDSCYALYKQLFVGSAYPYSYDLNELAQYYAAFRRLIAHWRSAIPERQLIEVSYENIVADFEGQARRVMAFLDLPWRDEILRFHESAAPVKTASAVQVRQPIYASSIGKWRNYEAELEPLRARLAELMPGVDLG